MFTRKSSADLSQKTYYIAKDDGSNGAILADGPQKPLLGILLDGGRGSGDGVNIADPTDGSSKVLVIASAVFTQPATTGVPVYLTSDANGKANPTTTANDIIVAFALYYGNAANDQVQVQPCSPRRYE